MTEMTLFSWVAMALLLVAQNFAFTVVSRARNSGSDAFHAIASVFSNGIWVVVNFLLVQGWTEVMAQDSFGLFAAVAGFYIAFTVIGSVFGGKVSRTFFERGKRRVGHYEDKFDAKKEIAKLRKVVWLLNEQVATLNQESGLREERAIPDLLP